MKHAYLIIAHNEFEVLKELIKAIDYIDNDIYIHFDKKVADVPELIAEHSSLFVIKNRIDVRWGSTSQIKCEYQLFEIAYAAETEYSYYHLISGVHFPLRPQSKIHSYFDSLNGKSVLSPLQWDMTEIKKKIGRYHFFVFGLNSKHQIARTINNILWRICLKLQGNIFLRKTNFLRGNIPIGSQSVMMICHS